MTSIVTIAAAGSSQATATLIPASLVFVTLSASSQGVILPTNPLVGDTVEIHFDDTMHGGGTTYPNGSDTMTGANTAVGGIPCFVANTCVVFRCISDNHWGLVSAV